MTTNEPLSTKTPGSARLRAWLIAVSIIAALAFLAGIPAAAFTTAMVAGFGGDDPSTTVDQVMALIGGVLTVSAIYFLMLIAGVIGGWLAYRKRRNRLSFWLSLLAAVPVALIILAILALFAYNFFLTLAVSSR